MVDFRMLSASTTSGIFFNPRGAAAAVRRHFHGTGRSGTEEHVWCPKTGVALNFDMINYHIRTMNDYPSHMPDQREPPRVRGVRRIRGRGECQASMSGITVRRLQRHRKMGAGLPHNAPGYTQVARENLMEIQMNS
jgi:hypothetical protein